MGDGGVIAIDHDGNHGISFNTTIMSHAYLFNDMDDAKIGLLK